MRLLLINRFLTTCVLFGLVLAATLTAQDKFKDAAPAAGGVINDVDQTKNSNHLISRYLEDSTFALIEIDISKVNVIETIQFATKPLPDGSFGHGTDFAEPLLAIRDSLTAAGVQKVYYTMAPRSAVDGGGIAVFPCDKTAAVDAALKPLLKSIRTVVPYKTLVHENVVLVGPSAAVDRLVAANGSPRGDLIIPLSNSNRLDHTLSMSLSAETRSELQTLWPDKMPESFPIKLSPRQMIADVNRVVVSWSLPPKAELIATIETTDQSSVKRAKEIVDQAIGVLTGNDKAKVKVITSGQSVVVAMSIEQTATLLATLAKPARYRADRLSEMNDMKQIVLAFHNYADAKKHFPPLMLVDQNKKPLHSWRTVLLAHLEQNALYKSMRLHEPWDSDHNKQFGKMVIPPFNAAMRKGDEPWKTRVRAPVFEGGIWGGEGNPLVFRDINDGLSNTIAFIVAPVENATIWSSPEVWEISKDDPMKDVFGANDSVLVGLLDGSVRVLSRKDMTNERLTAMLTRAGRETIEW